MKKVGRMQIAACVFAVLPVIIVSILYSRLPDKIPMHWDFGGNVSYEEKWQLFLVAIMSPVMQAMFLLLPRIDPRKQSYDKFQDGYELFQFAMQLFMLIILLIVITEAYRPGTVNVATSICAICSLLFIVLGNMLPKFRQNFFCGFKNPWTLSSERVWTRTHRMAGKMMFASGVLGLVGAFVPNAMVKFIMLFVPIMITCIVPSVFSYIWFRQEKQS